MIWIKMKPVQWQHTYVGGHRKIILCLSLLILSSTTTVMAATIDRAISDGWCNDPYYNTQILGQNTCCEGQTGTMSFSITGFPIYYPVSLQDITPNPLFPTSPNPSADCGTNWDFFSCATLTTGLASYQVDFDAAGNHDFDQGSANDIDNNPITFENMTLVVLDADCVEDTDGDGYFPPTATGNVCGCTDGGDCCDAGGEPDCGSANPYDVNPGENEGSGTTCSDGADNDCDTETDCADSDCTDHQDCMGILTVERVCSQNSIAPGDLFQVNLDVQVVDTTYSDYYAILEQMPRDQTNNLFQFNNWVSAPPLLHNENNTLGVIRLLDNYSGLTQETWSYQLTAPQVEGVYYFLNAGGFPGEYAFSPEGIIHLINETNCSNVTVGFNVCEPDNYSGSIPSACCDNDTVTLNLDNFEPNMSAPGLDCPPGSTCYNPAWVFESNQDSCCGDDSNEEYWWFNPLLAQDFWQPCNTGNCSNGNAEDPSDEACCNDSSDCVFAGECYTATSSSRVSDENDTVLGFADVNFDGVVGAYCWNIGMWADCDHAETECEDYCNYSWVDISYPQPWPGEFNVYNPGCCGDDSGEDFNFMNDVADSGSGCDDIMTNVCVGDDNTSDVSCCVNSSFCVYNESCYYKYELEDVDEDTIKGEVCRSDGKWQDCDSSWYWCGFECGFTWITGGESGTFGEYNFGAALECCGDDFGEDLSWFLPFPGLPHLQPCNTGYCSNGSSPDYGDDACCNDSLDCVFEGVCYTNSTVGAPRVLDANDRVRGFADVNNDSVVGEFCWNGVWFDCDKDAAECEDKCNYNWISLAQSYSQPWPGEFNVSNPGCCGDDFGEYYVNSSSFQGGDEACCSSNNSCAWGNASGVFCCYGNESNGSDCGTCTDGVDNDCDGLTDDWDPDCFLPPVAVASTWNVSGMCLENATVKNYSIHVPTNEPGLNSSGIVGEPFFFCDDNLYYPPGQNISRDRDQDGQKITMWWWLFGDTAIYITPIAASADANHTFSDPGFYNVSLGVWDNDGPDHLGNDNFSVYVNVGNLDPVAVINGSLNRSGVGVVWNLSKDASVFGNLSVIVGENITFDGSLSYDQDEGGLNITSYEWGFNDSNITCPNFPGQLPLGFNESEYHLYCDVGVYNVSLFVVDDDSNVLQNISPGNDSTWMLVFGVMWAYILFIRGEIQQTREDIALLRENHDELTRRHRILLEEQENLEKQLDITLDELNLTRQKIEEFKVYKNAWESLHNQCLDSLQHCVESYENVTQGRLDWYKSKTA
ncbi:PKD domain-containing protein [Candidatus Altiarchaeota archaeon]